MVKKVTVSTTATISDITVLTLILKSLVLFLVLTVFTIQADGIIFLNIITVSASNYDVTWGYVQGRSDKNAAALHVAIVCLVIQRPY